MLFSISLMSRYPCYFRKVDSSIQLCDQIGKLKELMSGLGQMVVLVSMLLDIAVVTKSSKNNVNVGLLDEIVWWLWGSSSFDILLDSYSVSSCYGSLHSVSFKSEFSYLMSCFNMFYKITFISKCFYDSLIVSEIGCLSSMIGRLLSNVQLYWLMKYVNSMYSVCYSGFNCDSFNVNGLVSSLSNSSVISLVFDEFSIFRLSDEFYVLRFFLKGWLNWSEFSCWVYNGFSFFYLHSLFSYGFRSLVSLVFIVLHVLVDYLKKVLVTVFNLGLGAVCNVWISSFIFKGFAYELSTLDLWVFIFLVINIKSLHAFNYLWNN